MAGWHIIYRHFRYSYRSNSFTPSFSFSVNLGEELAKLLFVYVGMLGISVAVRKQEHVFIDF